MIQTTSTIPTLLILLLWLSLIGTLIRVTIHAAHARGPVIEENTAIKEDYLATVPFGPGS